MSEHISNRSRSRSGHLRGVPEFARPFHGLIDAVMVPGPTAFEFDGAIAEPHAEAIWIWMARDVAPDLIDATPTEDVAAARAQLDAVLSEALLRARTTAGNADDDRESARRLAVQLGGEQAHARLPLVLNALKCRHLLDKAESFGRAANAIHDEAGLALALQSMPLSDRSICALLFQAAMGQVSNPARMVSAAIRTTGNATEQALTRDGFAPLIEAIFSHAQAQIPALYQQGAYSDVDGICRAIERFHRLMRGVMSFVELGRFSRWATIAAGLTKTISEQIEPRLRNVMADINQALRRPQGIDRIDGDLVLAALNGCYVLSTVRDCRDSLAVNAVFDQTWQQVGQALEVHVQRNLDNFRQNPSDRVIAARLDAAIKMAELRFNAEYADILRRARDSAERRVG